MVKNNTTACTKIYERTPYSFSPLETAGCPARQIRALVPLFRFRPTLRLREAMSCLLTGNWRKRAGVEFLFNFIKSRVFTVLPTASQMNWS